MNTKNLLLMGWLSLVVIFVFSACSDDDDAWSKQYESDRNEILNSRYGLYIVSNGVGEVPGKLSYYNFETNEVITDVFEKFNKKMSLGNIVQHIIVYGSKLYITVEESGYIYVLDKNCKLLKRIEGSGEKIAPKMLEAYNGKVYVTLYGNNKLARIDTTTMTIDKTIEVGRNPEYVKAVNNKLYVANSGGMEFETENYGTTVSVVDLDLTRVEKEIPVVINPVELKTDKYDNLYLISKGNYWGTFFVPYTLQQINTATHEVTVLDDTGRAFSMQPYQDRLYLLGKEYDENFNTQSPICYYDIKTGEIVEESFITDGTEIPDIASVEFDPSTGNIFVTAANSVDTGDLYIFSKEGKLLSKKDVGGIFPTFMCRINK